MFFSENEAKMMAPLFTEIEKNPYEIYRLKLKDGAIVKARVNTCYETDNEREEGEEDYEEMFACLMQITDIVHNSTSAKHKKGEMIEITFQNYPVEIINSNGEKIG